MTGGMRKFTCGELERFTVNICREFISDYSGTEYRFGSFTLKSKLHSHTTARITIPISTMSDHVPRTMFTFLTTASTLHSTPSQLVGLTDFFGWKLIVHDAHMTEKVQTRPSSSN